MAYDALYRRMVTALERIASSLEVIARHQTRPGNIWSDQPLSWWSVSGTDFVPDVTYHEEEPREGDEQTAVPGSD